MIQILRKKRNLFWILSYSLIAILTACNSGESTRARELDLKEKELEIRQKELEMKSKSETSGSDTVSYVPPKYVSKYMYVVIETNEPKIISKYVEDKRPDMSHSDINESGNSYTDGYLPREIKPSFIPETRLVKYIQPQYYLYTSDVIELTNFNEDSRYREEDKFGKKIQSAIANVNRRLDMENYTLGNDLTGAEAKILSKKSFVFSTYSEASEHKQSQKQTNN